MQNNVVKCLLLSFSCHRNPCAKVNIIKRLYVFLKLFLRDWGAGTKKANTVCSEVAPQFGVPEIGKC